MSASDTPAGVIHNIGYRSYSGERLGRGGIVAALYGQTLAGAFGIGRGLAAKIAPLSIFAFQLMPAVIMVAVGSQMGAMPISMDLYTPMISVITVMYIGIIAPQAVSRDLRFGTLSLYFSRPLSHTDYVLAKFAATVTALFILLTAPMIVLFVGEMLLDAPLWETLADLGMATSAGLVLALMLAGVALLIASVTPRRGLGVAAVITVLLTGYAIAGMFREASTFLGGDPYLYSIISPLTLFESIQAMMFGASEFSVASRPDLGVGLIVCGAAAAIIGGCLSLLNIRYRKAASA